MPKKQPDHLVPKLLLRLFIGLLFIVGLYLLYISGIEVAQMTQVLLALLLGSLLLDLFDKRYRLLPDFVGNVDKVGTHFSSRSYFLLGSILSLAFFSPTIAFTAITMTLIGTIGGQIVRQYHIKILPFNKATQGFIMAMFLNLATGIIFFNIFPTLIAMAIIASILESYATGYEDDLLIPLFAGATGEIILAFI